MSIDLIAALRKGDGNGCRDANALMARAADEVERLRAESDSLSKRRDAWHDASRAAVAQQAEDEAERDRLRAAVESVIDGYDPEFPDPRDDLRAALDEHLGEG